MDPTIVSIPLVGGPADGNSVMCVIGPDGLPPMTHWQLGPQGLADAPFYELERVSKDSPPWRYRYRMCVADVAPA
jgi:hypothetical protein